MRLGEGFQRPGVPPASTGRNEPVGSCILPGTAAAVGAESCVPVAPVPGGPRRLGPGWPGGAGGVGFVDQPGAGQVIVAVVGEVTEFHDIDRDTVESVQVGDDAFGPRIQVAGDDGHGMPRIQFVGYRCTVEAFGKGLIQVLARVAGLEDVPYVLVAQFLDPGGIVQSLGHDVPRGAVTFELQDVQHALGIQAQHVDVLAVFCRDLVAEDE